jgi:hypothetical protein
MLVCCASGGGPWKMESLWLDIVRIKYVKNYPTCPARLSYSLIWSDLMKVGHIYLRGRGIKATNGQKVSF